MAKNRKIDMSDIHITPFIPELRLNTMVGYTYRYTSMSIVTDWYLISMHDVSTESE